ncbi:MAG TPA: hypothetical protein VGG30_04530 [Pirellulales bacterium]|jgi:hypothetical protein
MIVAGRTVAFSLIAAGLGAVLGVGIATAIGGTDKDAHLLSLVVGCVGAIVGVVVGGVWEIVMALNRREPGGDQPTK